jgi:O-antigen/teichoic acid export membrane protein
VITRSARWLVAGTGSLQERVLRSGVWLLAGDGAARAAGLLKVAILGRLLSPSDFGLMGVAVVLLGWLDYFTQTGISAALIRWPGTIGVYLDAAWTIQVLRGAGLAAIIAAVAPLWARFLEAPAAVDLIRVAALVPLLRAFVNPAVVYLRKEVDFRREVLWRLSGVTAGLVVAVPTAFAWRNAWALVSSVVAAQAVETACSYWIEPYRPRLRADAAQMRELFLLGRWFFWSNIVSFVGLQLDSLGVGKILGATALGFYQMAHQLAFLPASQLGTHVQGVIFPAFSKLAAVLDLRRALFRTLILVASAVIPVALFLTLFADPMVLLVLGEKWRPIAPVVKALAWAGAAAALTKVTGPLLQAAGRPELQVRASVHETLVLAVLLYPLMKAFGISGAALALLVAALWLLGVQAAMVARLFGPIGRDVLRVVKAAGLCSSPFLVVAPLVPLSAPPSLWVLAAASLAAYLGILATVVWSQVRRRPTLPSASRT